MRRRITPLLLWIQRRASIDVFYLARGGFWTVLGQVVNGLLSLGLIVAFANLLPKETYGVYRYILSVASVLNIFTLTGMGTAISRTVARGGEIFRASTIYQLKWNLLMLGGFCAVAMYYFANDNLVYAYSFLILGLFIPASIALNTYGSYLEGKREFKLLNIYQVLSTTAYSIGTLAILLVSDGVVALVAVYAGTTFVTALFFYWRTLKKFAPPDSSDISATATFGRELTYLKFIDPIASQIDKIILAHFWGPAHLATYALAIAIPNRAILFMKSWVNIGFPKFAMKTSSMIDTVFYKRILQGMLVGTFATLGYALLAPPLFTYALPQYIDSTFYSQLLAVTFIFALPNRYVSLLLASQGLSRTIFIRSVINSVLNILLYLTLGIWGGMLGLITATILSSVINLIMNIVLWKTHAKSTQQKSEEVV